MISVCMATYNGEEFIEQQVASILSQLGENDELIISDDMSSDRTMDFLKTINDSRVSLFFNKKEKGYTRNFENALRNSKGDFIFLSDQDDYWFPDKVSRCLDALSFSDMVVCNAILTDRVLNKSNDTVFERRRVKSGFFNNFIRIRYLGCSIAFRKEMLSKVMPIPGKQTFIHHDSWITLVGEFFYNVVLINEPLMYYRRHDNNISVGVGTSQNSICKKIIIRLMFLFYLLSRIK